MKKAKNLFRLYSSPMIAQYKTGNAIAPRPTRCHTFAPPAKMTTTAAAAMATAVPKSGSAKTKTKVTPKRTR